MATLRAKNLHSALQKARRVGRVEEPVEIAGCPLVLQSLTPADYEAIVAECAELDDVWYYHAYQIGHVCRAIVEIDGEDLRDVNYIEDEIPDPKDPTKLVTRKMERHEWIKTNLIAGWGREAIIVAWRKFAEVLVQAEKQAKEGVHFSIPDESAEDKLRRLLKDVGELQSEIPTELTEKILSDAGFLKKSSMAELDAVAKRVDGLAELDRQVEALSQSPQAVPAEPAPADRPLVAPAPQIAPPRTPAAPRAEQAGADEPRVWRDYGPAEAFGESPPTDLQQRMQNRVPLNQQAVDVPAPTPTHQSVPVSAQKRVAVPAAIRQGAQQNTEALREPSLVGRAAQLAALEAQADAELGLETPSMEPMRPPAAEIRSRGGIDPRAVAAITEQPPVAGVNRKFRQPPKL